MIMIINVFYIASISLLITVLDALQCIKTLKYLTTIYISMKIK